MNIEKIEVGYLGTNCYLVEHGGLTTVIDPGGDAYKIISSLKGGNIDKILLTHGHFDHIMAAEELRQKTGAKIYISREDAIMTENSDKSLYFMLGVGKRGFNPFIADNFYEDSIDICNKKFKVIKTPGHSMGSVCFYHENILFSGDTLFAGSIGRYDYGDYGSLMNSLSEILLLPDDTFVYPGHGNITTIGQERRDNPFLR